MHADRARPRHSQFGKQPAIQPVPGPDAEIALAINSEAGRSQNLLHIHISCVLPALRVALDAGTVPAGWASEPFVFFGESRYNARQVESLGGRIRLALW